MRGKRRRPTPRGRGGRFIPAHAGKTSSSSMPVPSRTVHPRACGENMRGSDNGRHRLGSSPRMRGKRALVDEIRLRSGFIPAHAGKTARSRAYPLTRVVHPRACGENVRQRGRLQARARFIPAHAGKTPNPDLPDWLVAVHPRACGENLPGAKDSLFYEGSSPRMRGKRRPLARRPAGGGFIPAHAGKTRRGLPRARRRPVHPRACGENHPLA